MESMARDMRHPIYQVLPCLVIPTILHVCVYAFLDVCLSVPTIYTLGTMPIPIMRIYITLDFRERKLKKIAILRLWL